MLKNWYTLRSKPRKEEFLWGQLAAREIEAFYPCIRVQPANPRSRKESPYFPGYLFVRLDLEQTNLSDLLWMPGSTGLVSFGGSPPVVPEGLVSAIRRRVDQINVAAGELFDGLQSGDEVVVQGGPFAGYEATPACRVPNGCGYC